MDKYFQRERGRALRGQKVEDTKRGRKFQRLNIIGALCNGKHIAIECYKHKTNSAYFEQWFVNNLLKEIPKGYTIIMDRASFHRKKELQRLADEAGDNLLFLPAYSPDFNHIELSWANMKRWLSGNMPNFTSVDVAVYAYFTTSNI